VDDVLVSLHSRQTDSELQVSSTPLANSELGDLTFVARTGQAVVYKGLFQGKPVAVKQFIGASADGSMKREVDALKRLLHQNVLPLIEYIESPYPCILTKWMDEGDLMHYLSSHGPPKGENATKLMEGIARGLNYIHERKIIHRDLKSLNILLSKKGVPKIADFGLAKIRTEFSSYMTRDVGSLLWSAPEILAGQEKYDEKVDIYAFGIVLWEIVSGNIPYKGQDFDIWTVLKGNRPAVDKAWSRKLVSLMQDCWQADPVKRPIMLEVLTRLTRYTVDASNPPQSAASYIERPTPAVTAPRNAQSRTKSRTASKTKGSTLDKLWEILEIKRHPLL